MQTINAYWLKNIIEVQVLDLAHFKTRNRIVYSRTIKIYAGIDNPIHIVIKNQDQKPVDATGYTLQLDIQDMEIAASVASIAVTYVDVTKGLAVATIPKATVDTLTRRYYHITLKKVDTETSDEMPTYIDDNYGAMLPLEVLPGWYQSLP